MTDNGTSRNSGAHIRRWVASGMGGAVSPMPGVSLLPIVDTLRTYERGTFRGDLTAGLTTAVMLVPQGMAYAVLAGLDPIVGLYASTVPVLLYAVFGTSAPLAVGPVALDSMLVAAAVAPIAARDPSKALTAASLLAGMVGALQLAMGLLRLGRLAEYVSRPVLSGFTTAAAVLIAATQLGSLIGVSLPRSSDLSVLVTQWIRALPEANLTTVGVASVSIASLVALKRWSRRFPRFLLVVSVAVLASWGSDLASMGVPVVGHVPAGLPMPAWPEFDLFTTLIPAALSIAAIGTVEVVAIGRHFARERGEQHRPSQELIAIGIANLGSGVFRGYPVAGGFSRSAVHGQAGARTPIAGAVTAVTIGLVLLVLTPVFEPLPKAVLAAIIVTAIAGLVDVALARQLWRTDRPRLVVWTVTLAATLLFGMLWGLAAGLMASTVFARIRPLTPRGDTAESRKH